MFEEEAVETIVGRAWLRRSGRKTLGISVHPNGVVELAAPARARIEDILAKVTKRAAWIRRQRRNFAGMNGQRAARRYSSGATHRYLGKQYRLKVIRGESIGVKLMGGYFHVVTEKGTEEEVEKCLAVWMRTRAMDQLSQRVEAWKGWCQRNRLPSPRIHLRNMPKRWGSAKLGGRIWFNPELVRAPSVCIDYVVAHEICHLKHPNHGPEFYRQLDLLVPDWRKVKRRLECSEL